MADIKKKINLRDYDILQAPLTTEKTSLMLEKGNWVTFRVPSTATKIDIRNAVENLFSVKVEKVNTLKVKGKTKSVKGRKVIQSDWKKAMIKLESGQTIDVGSGV